ncbi:MAG: hypothetical protein ACM3VX_06780 [Bacteroidota bacterium]
MRAVWAAGGGRRVAGGRWPVVPVVAMADSGGVGVGHGGWRVVDGVAMVDGGPWTARQSGGGRHVGMADGQ